MRRSIVLVGLLVLSACGGSADTDAVSPDARAREFAVSARRALTETRFEPLGDRWVADLVLAGCDELEPGIDANAVLAALALRTAAAVPPQDGVEDRILAEVLAAGVVDVCPDVFASATTTVAEMPDPEGDYLSVVVPIAEDAGVGAAPDVLLDAGNRVCEVLDRGDDPERAILDAAGLLFDAEAEELEELGQALSAADGTVLGSVLAASASYLCPRHADTVVSYVEVLEARE